MQMRSWINFGALVWAIFLPIFTFGFPIFPPPNIASINCSSSPSFFGDNSNTTLGFAGGTMTNVSWQTDKVALVAAQATGTFTSRVIDNSCVAAGKPWLYFPWTSSLPFGKELPAGTETSTSYSSKNTTTPWTTNLIGLWHFNEAAAYNGTANETVDSSGNGNHATLYAPFGTNNTKVTGLFNNGFNTIDGNSVRVTLAQSNVYTFSTWLKLAGGNTSYLQVAQRDDFAGSRWSIQIDNTCHPSISITGNGGSGYIDSGTVTVCDGLWHHIVLAVSGVAITGLSLWVDGVKYNTNYTPPTSYAATDLWISSGVIGTYDEAALWHRLLSDAEILELYRRGANRVRIQVRNCTSSTCADNPAWQGSDGTAATYFTELNNNSNQLTQLGTVQVGSPSMTMSNFSSVTKTNRYIQYKFILDTDNTTYSPDIKSIGPGR
jgi:trimeric autotransporter adhesin